MPILQGARIPSATNSPYRPDNDINSSSVQPTPLVDTLGEWSISISVDPNRPDFSTTGSPSPTATTNLLMSSVPAASNGGSVSTTALVGIIVSGGIIVITVAFAIIWWIRRRDKSYQSFGHRQQQQQPGAAGEGEEKPPTYEAAVFGIYRNDQANLSLHHIPQQSPPALQTPQPAHHIHSPRPFNAATANGTLLRLDTTVPHHQNIAEQHADIVVYPHDSPPPPPTPAPSARQSALSIRSSPQINFNSGSDEILASHHITDFSGDYPSTMPFNSDFSDNEPTVAREII